MALRNDANQFVHIKLADGGDPFVANYDTISFFSKCAAELPMSGSTALWDFSNLLIGGQPVRRRTALLWLNVVYQLAYAEEFGNVPATEGYQDVRGIQAGDLADLLEFADAVASMKGVIGACIAGLASKRLCFTACVTDVLGIDDQVYVVADDRAYMQQKSTRRPGTYSLSWLGAEDRSCSRALDESSWGSLVKQVCAQAERLLAIVIKLQLQRVVQEVESFIVCSMVASGRNTPLIAQDALVSDIYTPTVCQAAGFSGAEQAKIDWMKGRLRVPCSIAAKDSLLNVHCAKLSSIAYRKEFSFKATLGRDFGGMQKGAEVQVNLAGLFAGEASYITIGELEIPARLTFGL